MPASYRFKRMVFDLMVPVCLVCLFATFDASAQNIQCDDCYPRIGIKTNLLHDVVLTPDVGIEISVAKKFSLSMEGVYAWWSNDSRHRYWRVRGGSLEMRIWLGENHKERSLSGHHVGIYGSFHDYDFEFGGKGWQSPTPTYGAGIGYGFAIPINKRINIDFGIKAGYSAGTIIRYRPECGEYMGQSKTFHRYVGLTGLEITLVWFPGKHNKNNPNYGI